MSTLNATFTFTIEDNAACWPGTDPCPFEQKLALALPNYALEQLRARFFFALTTNHDTVKSTRVAVQMANETEIGTTLTKVITVPPDVYTSTVCEREAYIAVDTYMQQYNFIVVPALKEAINAGVLPPQYVTLFTTYVQSDYARYRMSAIAALLCHAAEALQP